MTPRWPRGEPHGVGGWGNLRLPTEGLRKDTDRLGSGRRPDIRATAHAADPLVGPFGSRRRKTVIRRGPKWHLWTPLKEKKKAPVRRQKTWRNLAWTNAKRQPFGNGSETAKHHLNPSSGEAENAHSQRAEVAPLDPLKEKKKAPVRRQKTWRNLAWTNAKRQPLGNGSEIPSVPKWHLWT